MYACVAAVDVARVHAVSLHSTLLGEVNLCVVSVFVRSISFQVRELLGEK